MRRHWLRQRAWQAAASGLLIGSVGALALAVARRWGWSIPPGLQWGVPLAAATLGVLAQVLRPPDWESVARAVDARYGLKDRTITAWSFAACAPLVGLYKLQVDDALERLRDVDPAKVVPRRIPTRLWSAIGLWLVAMVIAALPEPRAAGPDESARQEQVDHVNRQVAEQLEASLLKELQRLAQMTGTAPADMKLLQRLPEKVADQLKRLKQPGHSPVETLMTLSEIQAAVEEASRQLQDEAALAHLQQLGSALSAAESLENVAESLDPQQLEQAAEQMRQVDPQRIDALERTTLAEELKPLIDQWRGEGDDRLAEAAERLQEGLEESDAAQMRAAADQLAEVLKAQALRMAVQADLGAQLNQLSEAKGVARSGGNNIARSDQSRETWGRGRAGDPLSGQAPQLATTRQREELTGIQGEGPSDRQTMRVQANEGQAERPLESAFRPYQQSAEEVLRRESLPLGYRRTIREYFRSIRP
jgi:hypothetical protein